MKRSDAGDVEFMGMLPLIIPLLLLVWEGFLIGMSFTYAGHAANEGARAAAVGGSRADVEKAAMSRLGGAWADKKNVTVDYPSDRADPNYGYVQVRIRPPVLFPRFVLPMSINARARVVYEGVE